MVLSKIKLARVTQGLTQADIWKKTDIPQWKVSLIERGLQPSKDEAERLATVLGCDVKKLFPTSNQEVVNFKA